MVDLISLHNVKLQYVLRDVAYDLLHIPALRIIRSQWTILYGPSGSGKTSLLNALTGMSDIDGIDCYFHSKDMAYMPQQACLLEGLSIKDNAIMLAELRGNRAYDLSQLADQLKFSCALSQSVYGLSGGERMKLSCMRALLMNPTVFFLDEPSSQWDSVTTHLVMNVLKKRQLESGMSIIMVTHDNELLKYADAKIDVRIYQ